jgi:5'-3' exonuclease
MHLGSRITQQASFRFRSSHVNHAVQAPGEAEAELAQLNKAGLIDAVVTDDNDALIFGATHVIRKFVVFIY